MGASKKKLTVILILAVSCCLSLSMILFALIKTHNAKENSTEKTVAATESMESETKNNIKFQVNFYDLNGKLIKDEIVPAGGFATPPQKPAMKDDAVFLGWSGSFLCVIGDTDCRPSYKKIDGNKNFIFADAYYIKSREKFKVNINVGGVVDIDELKLTVSYDPKVLKYLSSQSDYGKIKKIKEDNLQFNLNSGVSLNGFSTVATIEFKAVGESFTYSDLSINGVEVNADHSVINGKIYIY